MRRNLLLYRCVKGDVMAYYLTIRKKDTYIPIDNPTELSNLMCDIMANK